MAVKERPIAQKSTLKKHRQQVLKTKHLAAGKHASLNFPAKQPMKASYKGIDVQKLLTGGGGSNALENLKISLPKIEDHKSILAEIGAGQEEMLANKLVAEIDRSGNDVKAL